MPGHTGPGRAHVMAAFYGCKNPPFRVNHVRRRPNVLSSYPLLEPFLATKLRPEKYNKYIYDSPLSSDRASIESTHK